MKLSCDIIRDLLPLYAEELASADSADAVEEHLLGCESCRAQLAALKQPVAVPAEEPGLDTVRRGLWRRRLLTALCAVLIVCMAGCCFLSWLTAPIYLDKSIITDIQDNHDGTVTISMDAAAVGRQTFQLEIDPTDAGETIVLWTSRWLEWTWSEPIPRPLSITRSVIHNGIYLCTGTGEDELIYENPQKFIDGGFAFLPRLYLSFYFQMSLLIGSAALILAFLLRRRRAGKWLVCIGSLLVCYALCQGIVCGFTFASFFAEQELGWAVAMSLCLWGALMCLWSMRKRT